MTAVTVTTPADAIMVGEVTVVSRPDDYERQAAAQAGATLGVVAGLAKEAGVACEEVHVRDAQPWHGILEAAKQRGADMIVIASHGRRGLSALLIGSETQKVLSHAKIPVVVYR